jgi:hypothetical protein
MVPAEHTAESSEAFRGEFSAMIAIFESFELLTSRSQDDGERAA